MVKFLCAYLVIEIHTRLLQAVSVLLDKVVYYNISNYAVPFFYACTGYFLIIKQPEKDLHTKLSYRIKKIFNIYIIWSIVYLPLTVYGWFIEGNKTLEYAALCVRNYILVGDNFYSWALWYLNGLIFALILIDILSKKDFDREDCRIWISGISCWYSSYRFGRSSRPVTSLISISS